MTAEDDAPILALFPSPESAESFLENFPGFTGGILDSFKWMLQNMGSRYGIALNPESDVGFDLEPEIVEGLIQQLAAGETQH